MIKFFRTKKSGLAPDADLSKAYDAQDQGGFKNFIYTLAILIMAPVVALFLITFVFRAYEVDGRSMETTLQNHDRLIVVKVQRTWSRITGHPYVPKRGDVVIFERLGSADYGQSTERELVKRVIGLPGERVVVHEGVITVYNKQNPTGFQPDKTLAYGKAILTTSGEIDITIPDKQVFVCGDNRSNSLDSRIFGPVPVSDIIGKLSLRVVPINKFQKF